MKSNYMISMYRKAEYARAVEYMYDLYGKGEEFLFFHDSDDKVGDSPVLFIDRLQDHDHLVVKVGDKVTVIDHPNDPDDNLYGYFFHLYREGIYSVEGFLSRIVERYPQVN